MANYTSKTIINKLSGVAEIDIEDEWLNWADDEIERRTDKSWFDAISETLEIDGPGGEILILPKYPIVALTEVKAVDADGTETPFVLADDIVQYEEEGILKIQADSSLEFYVGLKNIEVTGKFGEASVPPIIEELATLLVIQIMSRKSSLIEKLGEVEKEKIGDYSITYKKSGYSLSTAIKDLWNIVIEAPTNYGAI